MLRNRLEYGLILAGLLLFYLFFSGYLSFFLLVLFLALPVFSLIFGLCFGRADLRLLPGRETAVAGGEFSVEAEAAGGSGIFGIRGKLKLLIRNEFSGESRAISFPFSMDRRRGKIRIRLSSSGCGLVSCQLKGVRFYDPLWLFGFSGRKKALSQKISVLVLPDFLDLPETVSRKGTEDPDSGRYAADRAGDDVSELYDIREYRAGDPVSRIHWKLLGRQEEIYIKEGGFPLEESPLLAADLAETEGEGAEAVLKGMLSLSRNFAVRGIRHRIGLQMGAGEGVFSVFSVEGEASFYETLREIFSAARTSSPGRPLFIRSLLEERGVSGIYYFTEGLSEREAVLLCGEGNDVHVFQIRRGKTREDAAGKAAAGSFGAEWKVLDMETGTDGRRA